MSTPIYTITRLIEDLRDLTARVLSRSERYAFETDAVLYGKIAMLEKIAECAFDSRETLTESQRDALTRALDAAEEAVSRIRETLTLHP